MSKRKNRGSSHAQKDFYLRPECWVEGQCAFYLNSEMHDYSKYRDFHERQVDEAGRLGKS